MKLSQAHTIALAIGATVASCASSALAADNRTDLLQVDAKNFSRPTIINNKYMPLKPGSQMVYEGWAIDEEDRKVTRKVTHTVTDLVKEVNGIETVVLWKQDLMDGKLTVSELCFLAQDNQGNVWHLGEAKELYDENVKLIGAKVWLDGFMGTQSGIIVPAKPTEATPSFSQGSAKGVYTWDNRGQVRKLGETVTTPAGTFNNVLVIEEWSHGGPPTVVLHLKYYAPGVGYIQQAEGPDPIDATLVLTKASQLNTTEMDAARAEARLVEERSIYYGRDTKPPIRRQS